MILAPDINIQTYLLTYLEMSAFNRLHTILYWRSIVTVALFYSISQIKRDMLSTNDSADAAVTARIGSV